MIELRNYQILSVEKLRENILKGIKKQILCAPTGAGKTIMFSFMCKKAFDKGKKTLIITDRIELLTQAGGTLENFGLKPIEINSNKQLKTLNGVLYVGMAQTISRRLALKEYQDFFKTIDLVIIDEAHKQTFNSLLEYLSEKCIVVGATATPFREKNQKSLDDFYQSIVEVVKISTLINDGFLAKPQTFGVKINLDGIKITKGDYDETQLAQRYSEIKLYDGVYENYQRLTPNKKAIIFATNVESSKQIVNDFKEKGLPIEHIDGTTPTSERKRILKWFQNTPNAMVSNVGILNAGFDCPDIDVVILYRATMSLPLFLQMVGRGSRTTQNKKTFTILDFGNNIQRHGFWEQDREWSLKKKRKKDGVAPVKDCPECFAILPASTKTCNYCGHEFEKTEKEIEEEVIVELQQMSYQQIKDEIKTADFKKLEQIAKAKGYKMGWIYHQIYTQGQLEEYAKYKGYNQAWVKYQIESRESNQELSLSKIRNENRNTTT